MILYNEAGRDTELRSTDADQYDGPAAAVGKQFRKGTEC